MVLRCALMQVVSIVVLCVAATAACAQPTLPNLSASADKGVVLLSWTCQYTGVKAIAVQHSTDSFYNFKIIGYVKKLEKGVQAYVDGHADTGRNYYKLSIVFNSGLTWTSNVGQVYIDINKLGLTRMKLPANDSLQRFIVTEERYKPGQVAVPGFETRPDSEAMASAKGGAGRKVSLSFAADSSDVSKMAVGGEPPVVRKKITIAFDEGDMGVATFIKSVYVFSDPVSGHVRMELPDDVHRHRYSIQFYDQRNKPVLAVESINEAKVLLDRRNFQHKGMYRFVLKKDGVELEAGYINL